MKKLIALLLALVMVFALAACGGDSGTNGEKKDEKTSTDGVKGDWVGSHKIDMDEGSFSMYFKMSFTDDSYKIVIDEDKTLDSYEDLLDSVDAEESEKELAIQMMRGELGDEKSGKYEYKDGIVIMDGEETGKLENGKLVIEVDGEKMEFERA